ncbi:unnamed protein product, partial [Staurois parvus]
MDSADHILRKVLPIRSIVTEQIGTDHQCPTVPPTLVQQCHPPVPSSCAHQCPAVLLSSSGSQCCQSAPPISATYQYPSLLHISAASLVPPHQC